MPSVRLFLAFGALAAAFGLAALWQAGQIDRLRAEREYAARIAAGEIAETPDGLLTAGTGVVIIGRPAGARAGVQPGDAAAGFDPSLSSTMERGAGDASLDADSAAPAATSPPVQPPLGDFELEVQPGQTLSGIAHAHYGTAAADLVERLARYNNLADKNSLGAGHKLRLPPIEKLNALPASR